MEIKNWSKDLIMTFIGTTLSIVLTFGTAHVINTKQQREQTCTFHFLCRLLYPIASSVFI